MHGPGHLIQALLATWRREGVTGAGKRTLEYVRIVWRRGAAGAIPTLSNADTPRWKPETYRGAYLEPASGEPVISLLMPVFNTPSDILQAAIQSVMAQDYSGWELCICDDASDARMTLAVLEQFLGADPRIKITTAPRNEHIASATNRAAEFATGDFIGFLDHDDVLTPDAVGVMARAILDQPDADVIYSDEDKLEPDFTLSEPYLKPDWSPEHLRSVPYLLHLMLVRKSLFLALGGLRDDYTGAQDYDLSLRATRAARRVVHVPRVLYHWRKIKGSAAEKVDAKPAALLAGRRALEDDVRQEDPAATVTDGFFPGSFRVCWPVDEMRPVTLLIPTGCRSRTVPGRGEIMLVANAVESIVRLTRFPNYRILVLDDGAMPSEVRAALVNLGATVETYARGQGPFNYSAKLNAGFALVETEDVVVLNDDVEVISTDWLEALLGQSRRDEVGVVGARLLYADNRIQHAGVVLGVGGSSGHLFHNFPVGDVGYCGYSHLIRNYSAVTGAVQATRMSLVRTLGGYDTELAVDYNDIDFCLRLAAIGKRTVYTPFATLYHFEGSSLVRHQVDPADKAAFLARWLQKVEGDPYYNPSLPRNRLDCLLSQW